MSKDTFYFSHDYNARADDKIKCLVRKHGILGYGIFWAIIEDLYNNANAMRLDYEGIAYDLRTDEIIIKSIINDFDLFVIKDCYFGSISVQKRLEERNKKSSKASDSAKIRWERSGANIYKEDRKPYPQVYIIKSYNDDECFIKIGITNGTISERYSGKLPYKYDVLIQFFSYEYIKIESELNDLLINEKYLPKINFNGENECFTIKSLDKISSFNSKYKIIEICDRMKIICERNAIKERKGKERKEKKNKEVIYPSSLEVSNYFSENGYKKEVGIKAFNYYSIAEWKDSKGNKVRNWKQKMQAVWFKDENKIIDKKPGSVMCR